jgi:hypothetical protein
VPSYRLYTVASECRIAGPPKIVDYQDDQAAVVGAKRALDGHSIEIWNGSRLVARLHPKTQLRVKKRPALGTAGPVVWG